MLRVLEQAADTFSAAPMADNEGSRGAPTGDKKRKWADRDRRNAARGGGRLQHGSRPDKKRNTGRKEFKYVSAKTRSTLL